MLFDAAARWMRRHQVLPGMHVLAELERLRRGPVGVSGRELTGALDRVSELAGPGVDVADLSAIPRLGSMPTNMPPVPETSPIRVIHRAVSCSR